MMGRALASETWQGTPPASTPEERSTEFVPVQGGTESTSAESMLVAAYFLMWAALIAFLFATWRRQGRIEARIGELDKVLERVEKA